MAVGAGGGGGTFTDVVVAGGSVRHFKGTSKPDDPAPAGVAALAEVAEPVYRGGLGAALATHTLLHRAGAVCLLHSYANREHEDAVAAHLRDFLDIPVVCSADVAPEFREFERTSTTVLSAYLAPTVSGHLRRLADAAEVPLDVMSSAGG